MWPALIILGGALFGLLYGIHAVLPNNLIECKVIEVSPDYTSAQKEECRKLRSQQK